MSERLHINVTDILFDGQLPMWTETQNEVTVVLIQPLSRPLFFSRECKTATELSEVFTAMMLVAMDTTEHIVLTALHSSNNNEV